MEELSVRDRLLEILEAVESYQRLYPDTYIDRLIESGVTIREVGFWNERNCSNCGRPIPTDDRFDFISEEDVRFCYYCGSQIVMRAAP